MNTIYTTFIRIDKLYSYFQICPQITLTILSSPHTLSSSYSLLSFPPHIFSHSLSLSPSTCWSSVAMANQREGGRRRLNRHQPVGNSSISSSHFLVIFPLPFLLLHFYCPLSIDCFRIIICYW